MSHGSRVVSFFKVVLKLILFLSKRLYDRIPIDAEFWGIAFIIFPAVIANMDNLADFRDVLDDFLLPSVENMNKDNQSVLFSSNVIHIWRDWASSNPIVTLIFLPPSSPDLNLCDVLWKTTLLSGLAALFRNELFRTPVNGHIAGQTACLLMVMEGKSFIYRRPVFLNKRLLVLCQIQTQHHFFLNLIVNQTLPSFQTQSNSKPNRSIVSNTRIDYSNSSFSRCAGRIIAFKSVYC